MVKICNLRKESCSNAWDIRVDRSSILGNPFYMHSESERELVCKKYEQYFNEQIQVNKAFRDEINRLRSIYAQYGKLNLFCWCAPKKCHAETIAKFLEEMSDYLEDWDWLHGNYKGDE